MIKLTYSILMSSNIFFYNLLYIYKTSKDSSARYYQNNKDYKKYLERYESISQEEKGKKLQCGCEQHKSLPEEEKIL